MNQLTQILVRFYRAIEILKPKFNDLSERRDISPQVGDRTHHGRTHVSPFTSELANLWDTRCRTHLDSEAHSPRILAE